MIRAIFASERAFTSFVPAARHAVFAHWAGAIPFAEEVAFDQRPVSLVLPISRR